MATRMRVAKSASQNKCSSDKCHSRNVTNDTGAKNQKGI